MSTNKQPSSIERWKRFADETREEMKKLPYGRARDAMAKKLRQLEAACEISEWLASPGHQPPNNLHRLQDKQQKAS